MSAVTVTVYHPDRFSIPAGVHEIIAMLKQGSSVSRIETWIGDFPDEYGVSYTDDGLTMTAFFTAEGKLVGDWM